MKLYEYEAFPNPKRVRMFLAEKGVEIERVQIDVPAGEHRSDTFRARNPEMTVPCLELDDGSHIGGCVAISRYIEEAYAGPKLFGETAAEQGHICAWQRRVEAGLMDAVAHYFHHATPGLGALENYQNADWGQHRGRQAISTLEAMNDRLANKEYLAGDKFSIADITAFAGVGFGLWCDLFSLEAFPNVASWFARVEARPSAAA
ncbi:MAG: glutathione S-transferase family protein [Alphaproteobacteria bacterium]|nr:glutathione S-transferase family protein [Alphaproteobacteria bacterium]